MTFNINDREYLRVLAEQCARTYTQKPAIEADGVELLIEEDNHDNLVVAFRGTTFDGLDIIRDIRALPWWSTSLQTWCHRGFLKGAASIFGPLLRELNLEDALPGAPSGSRPGYILTGHSKGGAEATLVAAALVRAGCPPRALVTFGAPLAGGSGLRRWLRNVSGHRVMNRGDPIPSVPWLLGKTGVFQHHRGATGIDTSLNGVWGGPHNHKIGHYIDALGYTSV